MRPTALDPAAALPLLAGVYGGREEDFALLAPQLTAAWVVASPDGDPLGLIALRPSPAHGDEVFGGAPGGPEAREAAVALLRAAASRSLRLYAYEDDRLLPGSALDAVGFLPVAVYTRMVGLLPDAAPFVPEGFEVVPLAQVESLEVRLAAQRSYEDRIGHTLATPEAVVVGALGSDDTFGRLAFDAFGAPAGICRVWREGDGIMLGTPGVRRDARGTGLRGALLRSVFAAARAAGATHATLEAWGDTPEERAEDEGLGFVIEETRSIRALDRLAPERD